MTLVDLLPDPEPNYAAIARGRLEKARTARFERRKSEHDWGKHKTEGFPDCGHCAVYVGYFFREFTQRFFPEPEIPHGFRR